MRCRKVRSFLSAYSKDELIARRKVAVGEHLSNCADCREELQKVTAIQQATAEVPRVAVSEGFNARLLNRIAEERFAETRTNAHFPPKRAPLFRWQRAVPAVVTAMIVLLAGVFGGTDYLPFGGSDGPVPYVGASLAGGGWGDVHRMDKDWSLRQQMDQIDRVNRLSQRVTTSPVTFSFSNGIVTIDRTVTTSSTPYTDSFYQVTRVVEVYVVPQGTAAGEGQRAY